MSADDQKLNTTPSRISKPHEGLCVTCLHHDIRWRPFMQGHEVHGAQFLTCKVRSVRSVVNGETSDWCGDIRSDGAACAQWENDRACSRCKWAGMSGIRMVCKLPRLEKKFESGEFKGQSYWPECRGHDWDIPDTGSMAKDVAGAKIVYHVDVACGAGVPDWEEV